MYINELITFLNERIKFYKAGLAKEEQIKNKPTYKKEYARFFNSEFGFEVLIEFTERFGKENISPTVAVKLKELFEKAYPKYNVSMMSKKISKKRFSELLNEILGTNLSNLRSVPTSKDSKIEQIFIESIKRIKPAT